MRSLVTLLAALAVLATGCGGSSGGAAGGSAAELLKPGALVYWETVSDPDSDQWQQVEELLRRFPDGDKWIARLRSEFEQESKVSWSEVREALGERTVVAVYAESAGGGPMVVGLMNPDDTDKSLAVIRKLNEESDEGDRVVTRVVDGWIVLSDKDSSIDVALTGEGGKALADEEGFTSGLEELPEDSLSRVYVDVATAAERFAPQLQGENREAFELLGLDEIDFAGAWASAEDEGARLAAVVQGSALEQLFGQEEFSSKLLERVPDDAFAFMTFRGEAATQQLEKLESSSLYRMGAREVERFLGVTLEELAKLVEGEVAFYARPAVPIPELTLLLDAADPAAARQSAERVLRALAERGGGEMTEDGDVTTARFEGFTVNLGSSEGLIAISTSKNALSDLGAARDGLADTERFKDVLDAADAPDAYTGLVYVDLAEATKWILGFAEVSDEEVPPQVARNLEPLRSFVAYGTQAGNSASVEAFLEID